ncbi:MAG: Fur family transcriptional regulator [Sedimentisphaerales bacterium]|jgi:Fur family peroxide stress response transcriptional regulator|nr:Fur family transcriptional regulator [Sedimentisphaerales bacterium]
MAKKVASFVAYDPFRADQMALSDTDAEILRFEQICRQNRMKVTYQRLEIFRQLTSTTEHPDAETIYNRVRKKIPSISLDTVYRTLRLFEAKGLIVRVGAIGDSARYDATVDSHHHFLCTRCGAIIDTRCKGLDRTSAEDLACDCGQVEAVYIELRGICNTCLAKARKHRQASGTARR